jgi:2-polyprenyl-3-methyl-5-hydroxy-6-metoxy-1,4-benzoquinol methylase
MRLLVAIAHYGRKNRAFLERLLEEYSHMGRFDVDVVVVAEEHKPYLPRAVEQVVGLPESDPWSLPFRHRSLFRDRVDEYDLFVYSEDDTLIEERNLSAFLDMVDVLPEDVLPGFTRYEVGPRGERYFNDVHSRYHWDPTSIATYGDQVVAQFTNEHSACYVLTRDQLHRCIASGGFVDRPHEDRYDKLVSAGTDPYTQCGFHKVLPVSRFDDFVLHHLPNVYIGRMGISEDQMRVQLETIETLAPCGGGKYLVDVSSNLIDGRWDKDYHEPLPEPLDDPAVVGGQRVLSIGAGSGDAEQRLRDLGASVVAVPLDPIVGALVGHRGIAITELDEVPALVDSDGPFDLLLLADVLAHVPEPVEFLHRLRPALGDTGRVWVTGRNATYERAGHRLGRRPTPPRQGDYDTDGVHPVTAATLRRWLVDAGFRPSESRWWTTGHDSSLITRLPGRTAPLTADRVAVSGTAAPAEGSSSASNEATATARSGTETWIGFFDQLDAESPLHDRQAAHYVENLVAAVGVGSEDRVLDFGCGPGHVAARLASRAQEVWAWDPAPSMRVAAARRGLAQENLHVTQQAPHPESGQSFDLIVVNSVVQYLDRDELARSLGRWRDLLADGGRLVLSDVIPGDSGPLADVIDLVRFGVSVGAPLRAVSEGLGGVARYLRARRRAHLSTLPTPALHSLAAGTGLSTTLLAGNLTHFRSRYTAVLTTAAATPAGADAASRS